MLSGHHPRSLNHQVEEPHIRRIAILARPRHPGEHRERAASEEAAKKLGITVAYFPILEMAEIDKAFSAMRQERCEAVVVFPDHYMFVNRERISRHARTARALGIQLPQSIVLRADRVIE